MTVDWPFLLTGWTFRPLLLLGVALILVLYRRGLAAGERPVTPQQPRRFALSLGLLIFALMCPINALVNDFLFMRIGQHLLAISLFPATFMGSDPLPILFAGLPGPWRFSLSKLASQHQATLKNLTPKGACWFAFVAAVWLWYDPALLALTTRSPFIYDLALATMIGGALLHWWHVTAARPHLHGRLPGLTHMGYTIVGAAPLKIPGLIFLIAVVPIYSFPSGRILGYAIDPLLSQQLGGMLVWALGGIVYSSTAFGFFAGWMGREASKPEQPRTHWDNEEKLIAPHLE